MPKAKAKMFNILLSDLTHGVEEYVEPYDAFWYGVLHRLKGLQALNQWPDDFKTPEALVEEIKPYFKDNGVYNIIGSKNRHVSLQIGKSVASHALITHSVAGGVAVMIPDYNWAVHVHNFDHNSGI
jgi:hypothetical protein